MRRLDGARRSELERWLLRALQLHWALEVWMALGWLEEWLQ